MARLRYDIQVTSSQNGKPRRPFTMNRDALRPGSVHQELIDAVAQQWDHLTFGGKYASMCRGLDLRDTSDPDLTQGSVWMWGMGSAIVLKVVQRVS